MGAWEIKHVWSELAHVQEFPPDICPQISPLGQSPPHVGAWEIKHVSSEGTHPQEFRPDTCPQISPLGQSPPHVGASEATQEGTHRQ